MTARRAVLLWLVALLPLIALSNGSLWIDEANSALKAMQPSLGSWWQMFASEKGSDLQMPLYMFYLWAWEKIAGHSELALRFGNLPWLILGHYSLYRVSRRSGFNPLSLLAIASVNPFLWFYFNEARPYVMQYAGSCMVICGLGSMLATSREIETRLDLWLIVLGAIVLAGSSLLGMAWAVSAIAALAFIFFHLRRAPRPTEVWPLVLICLGLGALGIFYLWTLKGGAGGSAVGQMDARNLLYAIFELFGYAGLGPGRLQVRENGFASFQKYLLPLFALAAVVCIMLTNSARVLFRSSERGRVIAGLVYGFTAAITLVLFGFVANFHLLGRHFTPLSPLISVVIAIGVAQLWKPRWKIFSAAMWILWFASCLSLRFAPRHQKDDYRGAAGEARRASAKNETVWWAADRAAAKYYQLPIEQPDTIVDLVVNPTELDLKKFPAPEVVILSKPDLYDANHTIADYLTRENFSVAQTLPAFTVWRH